MLMYDDIMISVVNGSGRPISRSSTCHADAPRPQGHSSVSKSGGSDRRSGGRSP